VKPPVIVVRIVDCVMMEYAGIDYGGCGGGTYVVQMNQPIFAVKTTQSVEI